MYPTRLFTILLGLAILFSATSCAKEKNPTKMNDFLWKNRLVIAYATTPEQASAWVRSLKQKKSDIQDRHIIWIVITPSTMQTNLEKHDDALPSNVRRYLKDNAKDAAVLLIGKDGGIKSRSQSLDLPAIFRQIDSMPMRQREMEKQGK